MREKKADGRSNKDDNDDGRVIAKMNIEGMPWYSGPGREKPPAPDAPQLSAQLTKEETRSYIFGALKAALLVGGIFVAAGALFILFCVYVWLR
ncbi:MAG: hypothetical protein FWF44_07940 [Defluviitaleaceae bacterium]|nr:hypothetical protein [Defluviitaleaceae bacterium]